MMLRDDLMALDYLASRPEVDARRIGVTGMSMGATRSWWLMALDERIQTGVAVACLTRYQNLIEHEMLKAHGIYYFVPRPAEPLRHRGGRGLAGAAAGAVHERRPGRRLAGGRDPRHREGGAPGVSALRQGETTSKASSIPGQGHVYTPEMWAKTLGWMEERLGKREVRKTNS